MAESRSEYQKLPPGWDCKVDSSTGNCYYINYFTKTMQLEDPRMRYKQLQNERCSTESIPLQPLHGSPYHVYPTSNFPAVKAFQAPSPNLQNISASPLLSNKSQLQMEMSPIARHCSNPQTPRMGNQSRRSTIQETSFSNQIDTDAVVTKIQNMFPTAGENHIRLLLKKYYNREAVVISALQVEKHPVTMPGPFVTPPAQRHLFHSNSAFQMTPPARRLDITGRTCTSRTASPVPGGRFGSVISVHSGGMYGSPRIGEQMRNSPKPHSSPKMKLRYMKTIFPKADETLLLDILANSDNNVQKASEKLLTMGYQKKDFVAPKLSNRQEEEKMRERKEAEEKLIPLRPKEYTAEEKEEMKKRLQDKYNAIAEHIILMALESVNYSEDRAIQILQIVQEEEESRAKKLADDLNKSLTEDANKQSLQTVDERDSAIESVVPVTITKSPSYTSVKADHDKPSTSSSSPSSPNSILSSIEYPSTDTTAALGSQKSNKFARCRDKSVSLKNSPKGSSEDETDMLNQSDFKSIIGRIAAMGHNNEISKGPDDTLLLAEYVTWSGANPDISNGRKGIAVGPDQSQLKPDRAYIPQGRNPDICKGPKVGLAKGSIYSQLSNTNNIKCN